jgi:hypothetical protein
MIHLDGSSDKAGNAAIPVPRNDKASQVPTHCRPTWQTP